MGWAAGSQKGGAQQTAPLPAFRPSKGPSVPSCAGAETQVEGKPSLQALYSSGPEELNMGFLFILLWSGESQTTWESPQSWGAVGLVASKAVCGALVSAGGVRLSPQPRASWGK